MVLETSISGSTSGRSQTYLWTLFGICFLSNVFAGQVSTLMSVYLPTVVSTFLENTSENSERFSEISAYINALYLLGWAIGGVSWGVIADKIGRAKSFFGAVSFYGIFTLVISFVTSWEQVVLCRFLAGFGVGGILVVSLILLSEEWPEKTRAIIIGIVSIGFPIGIVSAGAVNLLVSDWRQGFLLGALPLTLALLSIWLLKESSSWYASRGDTSQGNRGQLLKKYRDELIAGSVIFGSMLIGLWAVFSWIPTWIQSLLDTNNGQTERGLSMMLLGSGGLLGGFVSGWICNAMGTKKSLLLCFLGCAIMSVILFGTNASFSIIIYVELAILAIFFGISQGSLSIYIPKLFPEAIRGSATGVCFNIGRIATTAAVFSLGTLVNTLGGYSHALLTFSSVFVLGFITIFFTKNREAVVVQSEI